VIPGGRSRRPGFDPRLPRALHPLAWWVWAIGLATAASRTTNPLLLGLIVAAVMVVVNARRTDAPWARLRPYILMGVVVIALRVGYRIVFGGEYGTHVILVLPEIPLPGWAAGVSIGGPVTLESVLAAAYDGLRLATLIVCFGAANVLADARRMLRLVPGALYEVGTALVVALSLAPQLIESVVRVRRARRLRGDARRGPRAFAGLFIPVIADALDRSLRLAAAMDTRGYGRAAATPASERRSSGGLVLVGLGGVCVGLYGLLDATAPAWLGLPMLLGGAVAASAGLRLGGRRIRRTAYRPDVWASQESLVAMSGIAAAIALAIAGVVDPAALDPSLVPLAWPTLVPIATVGILVAMLPAWLAPPASAAVGPAPVPARPASVTAVSPDPRTVGP
jgi:energy-coupling factor transport system permease protein